MAKRKDPFAVDFAKAAISEQEFTEWLRTEIQNAQDARAAYVAEGGWIDLYHLIYDQAEMQREGPWPNSANLTSWIGTVQVDAMAARVAQAICGVEPICTAVGWGKSASQTALVESIHEWQARNEYLPDHLEATAKLALIEGTVLLEVDEHPVMMHTKREITADLATDEFGAPMFDDKGAPVFARDHQGMMIESEAPAEGEEPKVSAKTIVEERAFACDGVQYRVLGGKDHLILPGHARNESEVWGYAKRFYLRPTELQQRERAGTYRNIDKLSLSTSDRDQRADETRRGITIAPEDGVTVEKEFWEVHLKYDIDDDGCDEWLIATISVRDDVLMRLEYDQLKQMRGVLFCPYPDPTWVYGKGHIQKLITQIFEHTAYRNMAADKSAMAVSAPITRLTTAYFNPDDQPIGPNAIIDVRDHNEIKQFQSSDVPNSVMALKRDVENAAERMGGMSDSAVIGINPEGAPPTATQVQTTSQASFIRVDAVTRSFRSSVSRVYDLRHRILKRTLQSHGDAGMEVPDDVLRGMESRGVAVPKDGPFRVKASDLDGRWMFKPKGSVQSSDKRYLLQNLTGLMQVMGQLAQMNPQFAANIQQNPEIVKILADNALYIFDVADRQKILDALTATPMGAQPSPMPGAEIPGAPGLGAAPPQGPQGVPPELIAALNAAGAGGAVPQ